MIDRLATLPVAAISAVCRRHPVAHLDVFGSVLLDDFRDDSDIDVLVTFLPDSNPTVDNLIGLEDDLTEVLGRKAHVTTRRRVIEHPNPIRRTEIPVSILPMHNSYGGAQREFRSVSICKFQQTFSSYHTTRNNETRIKQ